MTTTTTNLKFTAQSEAIILKGVASQILQMAVPGINAANALLKEFDLQIKIGKEFTHIVLCAGLDSNQEGFIKIPLINGLSYCPCFSEREGLDIARGHCDLFLKDKSYTVTTYGRSSGLNATIQSKISTSVSKTFRVGYEKNGRFWEVHERPNWL